MINWNFNMEVAPKDGTRLLLASSGSAPGDLINGPSVVTGVWVEDSTTIDYWGPSRFSPIRYVGIFAWSYIENMPEPPTNIVSMRNDNAPNIYK